MHLTTVGLLVLAVAIIACCAEPAKYRQVRKLQQLQQKRTLRLQPLRKLAKQQEPVTPYPNAEELVPEVAFEEGNLPDEVYGPPDQTYGPPEEELASADQLPSEEAPGLFAPHPDAEEFTSAEIDDILLLGQTSRLTGRKATKAKKSATSRLTQKRKSQKAQRFEAEPAAIPPVVGAAAVPIATQFPSTPQQYFVVNQQPFTYTGQFQFW